MRAVLLLAAVLLAGCTNGPMAPKDVPDPRSSWVQRPPCVWVIDIDMDADEPVAELTLCAK